MKALTFVHATAFFFLLGNSYKYYFEICVVLNVLNILVNR